MRCLSTRAFVVLLGGLLVLGCLGCIGCSSKDSGFVASGSEGNPPGENPVEPLGDACSIEFVSANPSTIALKGTGGPARSEISVLVFKVFDMYGHPIPKEAVEFKLSTEIGGLSISASSAVSDSEGLVQVAVKAGTMPTHIRVQATLARDSAISIVSDELAITGGLPDQNSISLCVCDDPGCGKSKEFFIKDKAYVSICFHAADHFNNFVPDGAVVNFIAEGGSIRGSEVIKDGVCSIPWYNVNPRPADGRITILAFCIGEESFTDYNGNGLFDEGDRFDSNTDDLAEPFCDDNENGTYDQGEEYWDYNSNGKFDGKPNGIYNGILCSEAAKAAGLCTDDLIYTQASIVLIIPALGDACSIEFISATPQTIALKGTGGPPRSELSALVFKVVDEYGNPLPDQIVKFQLSTEIGGLSLTNSSAASNSEGLVHVTVKAGTMPTHIRVQATLADDPSITIVSDELAITTGLPDQDSISLSADTLNPEAWNYDNEIVNITFLAADHFNNFVPDGTVVYFTTEGGSIRGSDVIKDGICTVPWHSGNPRPPDGRVTILAVCIGEESFTNNNASGLFDEGDWFAGADLAEPFRDDNENGTRDPGEEYWDYNNNGQFDAVSNGIYNGTLCSDEAEALGLCTTELVYNQASIVIVMSGSFADITFSPGSVDLRGKSYQTVQISIADVNNNPMPAGTTVSVSATNGKIIGNNSFKIPDTNQHGPSRFSVTLEPSPNDRTFGTLTVDVTTTPHQNQSSASISVDDDN